MKGLLPAVGIACLAGSALANVPASRARVLMGTMCVVEASAGDSVAAGAAADQALETIAALERTLSSWSTDSELSRLNATAASQPVVCSEPLFAVLDSAATAARETGGAFDASVEPLLLAWDVRGPGRIPTRDALDRARAATGWRHVTLEPATRRVRFGVPAAGLDLGGIGKGFALDRAAETLRGAGVANAFLNFGGQALARGLERVIDVAHPDRRFVAAARLPLRDASASTSSQIGAREPGRARRGHILDPRSGVPSDTRAAVTVVAPSATRADAFSTALLVMGRAEAGAFAQAHPEIGVLWLEPRGREVFAWAYNLPLVRDVPGVAVRWMTPRP